MTNKRAIPLIQKESASQKLEVGLAGQADGLFGGNAALVENAKVKVERAANNVVVTRVMPDRDLLATATETAQKLAAKPSGALRASKRLIKQASIGQLREAALKIEPPVFSERLRSVEAKEAFSAFLEKRPPNFTKTTTPVAAE